jgi:hypothetical protein
MDRNLNAKARLVKHVEDFLDSRAREVIRRYGLIIDEIPGELDVLERELHTDGKIELRLDDPATPLNIHSIYIRRAACALTVAYEFTRNTEIYFPNRPCKLGQFVGIPLRILRSGISSKMAESRARSYKRLIDKLEKGRLDYMERLVG